MSWTKSFWKTLTNYTVLCSTPNPLVPQAGNFYMGQSLVWKDSVIHGCKCFFALTEICHMIPGPTTNWTHKSRLVGMKALQPAGILSLFEPRAYLMTFTKSASKFQAFDSSHHPISAKRLCKGSGDTCPKWRTPHCFPISYFHVWHQHTRNRLLGTLFLIKSLPQNGFQFVLCLLYTCPKLIPSPLCRAGCGNCPLEAPAPFEQSWTRTCRCTS